MSFKTTQGTGILTPEIYSPVEPMDDPSVMIRSTSIGQGVFAQQAFAAHDLVGWITGDIIHDPDHGSDYCIDIGESTSLEPHAPFRFLNHSCEPNSMFTWDDVDAGVAPRVYLLALRDIVAGEQLTIDYNWAADCAIRCKCGAPTCRGWIVTLDEIDQLPVHNLRST